MRVKRALGVGGLPSALCLAVLWWWLPPGLSWRGATPERVLARDADISRELRTSLDAVTQTWIADHPARELAWNWGEGVLALGIERAFRATENSSYRDYLRAYLRAHAQAGLDVEWSDDTTPALAAIERVRAGDADFEPLVTEVVRYSMHAPRSQRGLLVHLGQTPVRAMFPDAWIDSLFHVVPTLMRYSELTGDPRYRDEGALQLLLFLRHLQDPATGLCTHAFEDQGAGEQVPSFASRAFWARGNGWMLAALVDALAYLPSAHPRRDELVLRTLRLEKALRQAQARSGLFYTLLLDRDSYQETAGSALILYGMAHGVRLGLFAPETRQASLKGARGLLALLRHRGGRTEVTGTSLGTNPIAASYRLTPTADQISYGVGAWMMAVSELLALSRSESEGTQGTTGLTPPFPSMASMRSPSLTNAR